MESTLEEKAARLVMIDLPGPRLDPACREHLDSAPWGGVVLFGKNVESREQVRALVEDLRQRPLLLAVDQEGGLVNRFRFPDMALSPGNMALAATGDPHATFQAYRIVGEELAELGLHLDFAPCLDVNVNPDNPIIGARSFGEDPEQVAEHGRAAIRGLRQGGVAPCAKHFPGHGDTAQDSHICLPTLPHSRERLEQVELVPFRAAVEEEVEAIMTAHVTFPALDPREGLPATLSEAVLTGLLRREMGYRGVIVTDSLAMKAVADRFGMEEAAVRAVQAGADLVLALGEPSRQARTVAALADAVRSGRLSVERLEESGRRLDRLRQAYPNRSRPFRENRREVMRAIAGRTVTLVRDEGVLPLSSRERVLILAPDLLPVSPLGEVAVRPPLAPFFQGWRVRERSFHLSGSGPPVGELAEEASRADAVVLALYARDRLPDTQAEVARAVLQANPRTVVVSLSSPYLLRDLPPCPAVLLTYNYTPLALEALAQVITGRQKPSGRLPVSLSDGPPPTPPRATLAPPPDPGPGG